LDSHSIDGRILKRITNKEKVQIDRNKIHLLFIATFNRKSSGIVVSKVKPQKWSESSLL
jgi:hypothetical protein